jgi:MraZ protein
MTVDVKGRLVIPARFRGAFEGQAVVSPYENRCLAVWTLDLYEQQLELQEANSHRSAALDQGFRTQNAFTTEIDIDKQGRFLLAQGLREKFNIRDEVVILGNRDHLEIWNVERFGDVEANLDIFDGPFVETFGALTGKE